jgi:predicted exporter/predicted O-methyltransferase YrrM
VLAEKAIFMRLNASINIFALAAVTVISAILLLVAINRIAIDTDMAGPLSTENPVLADEHRILTTNPITDQIAIDIGSVQGDVDRLVAAAMMVETGLQQSDLFTRTENRLMQQDLADLAEQVMPHLPVLFTAGELHHQVAPLLTDEAIRQALARFHAAGLQMGGPGQASSMAIDPLGLRHIVLARMAAMNPAPGATIHRGRFFSSDRRHLLILAAPAASGTDTTAAHALTGFFRDLDQELKKKLGPGITLTFTGAFRATRDHATIVNGDVQRVILWTTVGIGVLLLSAVPHPLAALLALLPALAGTVMALFVFSLFHDSISMLVIGFGGMIVSITVVQGIGTMRLVDDGIKNGGRHASREIRAVGLPAALTAVGAFGVLASSGIAVFEQLGWLAAMGIGFSVLFVHTVFPRLLRDGRQGATPTGRRFAWIADRLASAGWPGLALALLAAAVLAVFIRPHLATNLKPMRSVSRETKAADQLMADVWGDRLSSFLLITDAAGLTELQAKNDRLLEQLETETHAGGIEKTLTPSLFFPGPKRSAENLDAWNRFWTAERIQRVSSAVDREGARLGLAADVFSPFLNMITAAVTHPPAIPPSLQPLLGISRDESDGRWHQVTRITPRDHFESRRFYARVCDTSAVFDPAHRFRYPPMEHRLVARLGNMLFILGVGLIFLLMFFLADTGLLFTSLLPPVFAAVCTLGTLGMMGRPPDIPALMLLSVIIVGAGTGYTLFMVRGYLRYQRFDHPHFSALRTAVLSGAGCTLVGVAVLLAADHKLLQNAGWIAVCGIGYSLAGTVLILPPLLKRRFETTPASTSGILWRYRRMEPYPRLLARYRRLRDPLFDELAALVPVETDAANILDVGCGYGMPACWMADRYPGGTIHGLEPDPERARVAALALGDQGHIVRGSAPDLPPMDVLLNLATLFDVSHDLQDWQLEKTLERIHERLLPGGRLIMRSLLPPSANHHRARRLKQLRRRMAGLKDCYRDKDAIDAILQKCEFEIIASHTSARWKDRHWHVAKPR